MVGCSDGTGEYTVMLEDSYPGLIAAQVSPALNAAGDSNANLRNRCYDSGNRGIEPSREHCHNIAANANNRVHFFDS